MLSKNCHCKPGSWGATLEHSQACACLSSADKRSDTRRAVDHGSRDFRHQLAGAASGFFQLVHPDIALQLEIMGRVVDFAHEAFDVGIREGHGNWPGLKSHMLMPVEFRRSEAGVPRPRRQHRRPDRSCRCRCSAGASVTTGGERRSNSLVSQTPNRQFAGRFNSKRSWRSAKPRWRDKVSPS